MLFITCTSTRCVDVGLLSVEGGLFTQFLNGCHNTAVVGRRKIEPVNRLTTLVEWT